MLRVKIIIATISLLSLTLTACGTSTESAENATATTEIVAAANVDPQATEKV